MTIEEFMEFIVVCKCDPKSQIFGGKEGKEEKFFKSTSFEYDHKNNVLSINFEGTTLSLTECKNLSENLKIKEVEELKKIEDVKEMQNLEKLYEEKSKDEEEECLL